jgi:hypothetical protein
MNYSANIDPELTVWLRWVSESSEIPSLVRKIAEASFLADLPNYALLRPLLLELKRQRPRASQIVATGFPRLSGWSTARLLHQRMWDKLVP